MSKQYQQVSEFNRAILGIPQREIQLLHHEELKISVKSLVEETLELMDSHMDEDIVQCIDAMIDNIYFAMGVLYKMGIDQQTFERLFNVVHTANMTKRMGVNPKRGDGSAADAVKPEGWVSPEDRIIEVLQDLGVFQ